MNAETFVFKTRSEQRLEWLKTRKRPLTDEEAEELYRCLHAIYQRDWRRYQAKKLERELNRIVKAEVKKENTKLLGKVRREAAMPEVHP